MNEHLLKLLELIEKYSEGGVGKSLRPSVVTMSQLKPLTTL